MFRLIDQDLDGAMDYMMVQAGYQMTRANALLSVLAAKQLTAEEMDNLKTKSREAARRAYGPVLRSGCGLSSRRPDSIARARPTKARTAVQATRLRRCRRTTVVSCLKTRRRWPQLF